MKEILANLESDAATMSEVSTSARSFSWRVTFKAASAYFGCVFAVGFVLGPIRELWVIPRMGRVPALLIEGTLMLGVSVFFARIVVRHFSVPKCRATRLVVGVVAFGLLQAAEMLLAFWLRLQNPVEYLVAFWSVPGAISLVAQLAFGAIPVIVVRD